MLYSDLKARIQDLVDDPAGEFCTADYMQAKVAQTYDDLYNKLRMTGAQFDESVIELTNVKAGTSDLGDYFASGKELELLLRPEIFEWKLTGQDPTNYREVRFVSKVPDVQAGQYIVSYEWRKGNIYFTPITAAVDIRIRGEFLFSALKEDANPIQAGINVGNVLVYWTCALIGIVRGNPQWEKSYQFKGDVAFDDIAIMLTKADQAKVQRVGRTSRRRSRNRGYTIR
ncbi:MAG TPA: hypothetical protein VGP89_18035 [Candidatus Angelobacter sp.]|jgi:hypothetical protein|nr:hypothetical protein [Candidatus Angelobacter sp.]